MFMEKEQNIVKCPFSESPHKVIKHGMRNGNQRYYCKECKKAFQPIKKRVKYSSNEKTLLALLISILQTEKGIDISDMIKSVNNILPNIDEYRILEFEASNFDQIQCYNPRLLIGQNKNTLVLYKMAPENWKNNKIILKNTLINRSSKKDNIE